MLLDQVEILRERAAAPAVPAPEPDDLLDTSRWPVEATIGD